MDCTSTVLSSYLVVVGHVDCDLNFKTHNEKPQNITSTNHSSHALMLKYKCTCF